MNNGSYSNNNLNMKYYKLLHTLSNKSYAFCSPLSAKRIHVMLSKMPASYKLQNLLLLPNNCSHFHHQASLRNIVIFGNQKYIFGGKL